MAKIAILIGISQYQNNSLNPLPGATKDVEAMQRILQHPEIGDFKQVKVLLNSYPLAIQTEIQNAFSCSRKKDDLILLFFSGHGIKDEQGNLYLATHITRKNQAGELIKATAVPTSFVHDIMSNCRSKRQVVILDCCFSGAFAKGLLAKDDGSVDIRNQLGGEGRAVLTSSTSTQYSFEQKGTELSIYTHYLIEGMATGEADRDNDGIVSVDELHEYAKNKVQEALPAMKPEIYAIKEGYKIFLTRVPKSNAQLKYRQEVKRCFARRGKISQVSFLLLDEYRKQLGLGSEEAADIEEEVMRTLRKSQQKLQRYEQALTESIKQKSTLGEITQIELNHLRQVLALSKKDVAQIEARLIKSPQVQPKEKTSSNLSPAFLQLCQQELTRCIGPVANFILDDTLEQYPQIGQRQLLEVLTAEITNPEKAREFRQSLERRFSRSS